MNLLSSVAKAGKSVKRVVLTSSVAAMTPLSMSNGKGANNNLCVPICACNLCHYECDLRLPAAKFMLLAEASRTG